MGHLFGKFYDLGGMWVSHHGCRQGTTDGRVPANRNTSVEHQVDISAFSPGVYTVDLTLNDQHVVKKIVKL
jgi:hypothetical protein